MYFNKDDAWLSIGDIGTWQNGIILYSMHEKAWINTYEQFLIEKVWKKCALCQKRKNKGKEFSQLTIGNFCFISFYFYQSKLDFCICFFNCQSCKCGQLSHDYIMHHLDNPNFSSTSTVTKVVNVGNYHITIQWSFRQFKLQFYIYSCTTF